MTEPRDLAPVEFWFDFASGYAYFASLDIEALAARHDRTVLWRPFTIGTAFKVTGSRGLSHTPLKNEYVDRDWRRLARLKNVPFNPRPGHPLTGLPAIRAFYAIDGQDANAAAKFAAMVIRAYFCDGLDIDDPQSVAKGGFLAAYRPRVCHSRNSGSGGKSSRTHCGGRRRGKRNLRVTVDNSGRRTVLGQRPDGNGGTVACFRPVVGGCPAVADIRSVRCRAGYTMRWRSHDPVEAVQEMGLPPRRDQTSH